MWDAPLQIDLMTPPGALSGHASSRFVVGVENRLLASILDQLLPLSVPSSSTSQDVPFAERLSHDASAREDAASVLAPRLQLASPLVLVGPSGVGKTLLVQQALLQRRHTWSGSASDWGRSYQEARRADRIATWRKEIAACDLVVIEELDRSDLSPGAQYELRLAIDALTAAEHLLVVTAQREPGQWQRLYPAVRDRLAAGLTIPMRFPDAIARRCLAEQAAKDRQMVLSEDQIEHIVNQSHGSPRRLWGALIALEAQGVVAIPRRPASSIDAHESVGSGGNRGAASCESDSAKSRVGAEGPTLKQLIAVASRYFGVSPRSLSGPSRRKSLVHARGVTIHVIRRIARFSYAQIGAALGKRDHTTILHADRRISALASTDAETEFAISELERILSC